MGNFAENLNLGNRFRPPPPRIKSPFYNKGDFGIVVFFYLIVYSSSILSMF